MTVQEDGGGQELQEGDCSKTQAVMEQQQPDRGFCSDNERLKSLLRNTMGHSERSDQAEQRELFTKNSSVLERLLSEYCRDRKRNKGALFFNIGLFWFGFNKVINSLPINVSMSIDFLKIGKILYCTTKSSNFLACLLLSQNILIR